MLTSVVLAGVRGEAVSISNVDEIADFSFSGCTAKAN